MTQQASHQRLEVRRVLDFGIKTIAELGKACGIEEKQPEIAKRNLVQRKRRFIQLCLRSEGYHQKPSSKFRVAAFALSRLSNQYSTRRGAISVSAIRDRKSTRRNT